MTSVNTIFFVCEDFPSMFLYKYIYTPRREVFRSSSSQNKHHTQHVCHRIVAILFIFNSCGICPKSISLKNKVGVHFINKMHECALYPCLVCIVVDNCRKSLFVTQGQMDGLCKRDITPLLMHCSYIAFALSHQKIDVLVQERRNSIANALELHLSCINPSKCSHIQGFLQNYCYVLDTQ